MFRWNEPITPKQVFGGVLIEFVQSKCRLRTDFALLDVSFDGA